MILAAALLGFALFVAVTAALIRMRPEPPPTEITITASTTEFHRQMRSIAESVERVARSIGEQLLPPMRSTVEAFTRWHAAMVGSRTCPPSMPPADWERRVRAIARCFRLPVEILADDVSTRWWERPRLLWWRVDYAVASTAAGLRRRVTG